MLCEEVLDMSTNSGGLNMNIVRMVRENMKVRYLSLSC